MQESIGWEDVDVPVGPDDIGKVEAVWNVKLPRDLVECIMVNNGGRPTQDVFDVEGEPRVFNRLSRFNEDSRLYVLRSYEGMRDRLVDWVFPFAYDPAGNFLCLDYRENRVKPCIVFWDHEVAFEDPEAALTYAASSFTELLGMLYVFDFDPALFPDPEE